MDDDEPAEPPASSDDAPETPNDVCEQCGAAIDTNDWYPIAKERASDGTLRLHPFCSEDCKARWQDDRTCS